MAFDSAAYVHPIIYPFGSDGLKILLAQCSHLVYLVRIAIPEPTVTLAVDEIGWLTVAEDVVAPSWIQYGLGSIAGDILLDPSIVSVPIWRVLVELCYVAGLCKSQQRVSLCHCHLWHVRRPIEYLVVPSLLEVRLGICVDITVHDVKELEVMSVTVRKYLRFLRTPYETNALALVDQISIVLDALTQLRLDDVVGTEVMCNEIIVVITCATYEV